jgi:hypothetical protein
MWSFQDQNVQHVDDDIRASLATLAGGFLSLRPAARFEIVEKPFRYGRLRHGFADDGDP